MQAHLIGGMHAGLSDEASAGFHHIMHLAIDESPDDGVMACLGIERAVLRAHLGIGVAPDLNMGFEGFLVEKL